MRELVSFIMEFNMATFKVRNRGAFLLDFYTNDFTTSVFPNRIVPVGNHTFTLSGFDLVINVEGAADGSNPQIRIPNFDYSPEREYAVAASGTTCTPRVSFRKVK